MKHDLEQKIAGMASDFCSPAGAIPIERLIRMHLRRFEDLRERGLTWEQVSRLLAKGGITRRDGRAFDPAHLRGVYGRHRNRAARNDGKLSTSDISSVAASLQKPTAPNLLPVPRQTSVGRALDGAAAALSVDSHGDVVPMVVPVLAKAGENSSPAAREARQGHDGSPDCDFVLTKLAEAPRERDRSAILTRLRQSAAARRTPR